MSILYLNGLPLVLRRIGSRSVVSAGEPRSQRCFSADSDQAALSACLRAFMSHAGSVSWPSAAMKGNSVSGKRVPVW